MRCYRRHRLLSFSAATTAALAAGGAVLGSSAVAPATAHAQEDKPAPLTFNGTLEVNYTANFDNPATGSNTYLYNTNANQFALNLADLRIARLVSPEQRTGFAIRLIEGEVKRRTFNSGEYAVVGEAPNVLEAYVSQLIQFSGRDVKVDAGQFVTHVGYETIEIGANNFFSRNFLFQFPSPFYNAGIRAAYPVSDKTTITGFLYNRYNGAFDPGNSDLAPGIQIALTPASGDSLILNALTSRENLNGTAVPAYNKQQTVLDGIYARQLGESTRLVVEGLYRFGQAADATSTLAIPKSRSYSFFGIAGYGIFTMGNGNVAAIRGEFLQNGEAQSKVISPIGLAYPLAPDATDKVKLGSITASYELRWEALPNVRTLLEYRYDWAGEEFFAGKSGGFKKNQSTLTVGQVYNF